MQALNLGQQLMWLLPQGQGTRSKSSLFKQISSPRNQAFSQPLADSIRRVRFKKNETIFSTGDVFTSLYFVANGFLKADYIFQNGHYQTHRFIIPGDWFGLKGFGNGYYQSSTITLTDCDLVAVDARVLEEQMNHNVKIRGAFEAIRSAVLNQSNHHCLVLGTYSVEQKLAHFLIDFQERLRAIHYDKQTIELPMSRDDLKSHLGMTTESLSRTFTALEHAGCFKVQNRLIFEINFQRLQKVIDKEK
jgi:CRP/FNR family transcriptional regulator